MDKMSLGASRSPWGLTNSCSRGDLCPECRHERWMHVNEARCIVTNCPCNRNVLFCQPFLGEGI